MTMTEVIKTNTYHIIKQMINLRLLNLSLFTLLAVMIFAQAVHAEATNSSSGKIVKWKDEKGVTHYGDSVPAQYSNRDNSVMSRQGITIQRNKAVSYQDLAVEQAKQEQDKKDKALLSAFTNENEIDLARDRNLQLDQVTIEGLQLQKINSQKRLTVSQKYADGFVKRKKTIPTDLTADIKANQAEIAQQNQQIASRKASMTETRQRFDDDKKRYIALKNRSVDSSISSSQTPPPTKP